MQRRASAYSDILFTWMWDKSFGNDTHSDLKHVHLNFKETFPLSRMKRYEKLHEEHTIPNFSF